MKTNADCPVAPIQARSHTIDVKAYAVRSNVDLHIRVPAPCLQTSVSAASPGYEHSLGNLVATAVVIPMALRMYVCTIMDALHTYKVFFRSSDC